MSKLIFMFVLVFVADSLSQRIILPTWRPPPRRGPIIRTARAVSDGEPLWLYKGDNVDRAPASGDHPYLPKDIDDIKLDPNRRYARSVDSPSARRSSGSHSSSGSRDTGPTHPGYNRRNARAASDGEPLWLNKGDNIDRAPATGDHPYLPKYIDDIKLDPNRRYARSVDSPSAKRSSGGRPSSGSRDTGPTHPGYNRRNARAASDGEPLWLYQGDNIDRAPAIGDHPYLPKYIDDIKLDPNRRYARSLDSPSAKRSSGGRSSSGSRDTGPTHPGYNRRNA